MNKNLLIKQNKQLFDKLHVSELSNKRLKDELANLKNLVLRLEEEIRQLKDEDAEALVDIVSDSSDAFENSENLSSETDNNVVLSDEIEFGSKIIGEIVIKAALTSNKIKEMAKPNIKELVNLILGRTEVAKGEILNVVSSNLSFDSKIQMMTDVKTQTFEYFESVLEQ